MQSKLIFDTVTPYRSCSSLIHFITSDHGSFNFLTCYDFSYRQSTYGNQDTVSLGEYLPTSRRIVIFTFIDCLTMKLKAMRSFWTELLALTHCHIPEDSDHQRYRWDPPNLATAKVSVKTQGTCILFSDGFLDIQHTAPEVHQFTLF